MHKKINTLLFVGLFYQTIGFSRRLHSRQPNSTVGAREIDAAGECPLSFNTTGFCVQAQNCDLHYSQFNRTTMDKIMCGPRNQNRQNPYVCCELSKIRDYAATEPPPSVKRLTESPVAEEEPPTAETFNSKMCGTQLSSRIVGGESTLPGEFPWLARLVRVNKQGSSRYVCVGALVTPRVVITAAHCITSPKAIQLGPLAQVSLGEHETECTFGKKDCLQNRKVVNVSKLVVHPQYQPRSRNYHDDIGLVVLAEKVEFPTICLLREPVRPVSFVASGWGRTESGFDSNVKLKTTLVPFVWQQCVDKYATLNITIWEKQLCAGGVKGQDTCQGDSGGPLMTQENDGRWYAAGLVSFGTRCGLEGWPGVYTNVPSYINWITSEISQIGP